MNYLRFIINQMSPEESMPLFHPQIYCVSFEGISEENFPQMESLERGSVSSGEIYILFNALAVYLYVGKQSNVSFIQQIFKVPDIYSIDKQISEEEIFADMDSSLYLTNLYNIINQIRYQRQPFCEIKVLLEGIDPEAESILQSMLIVDNRNPVYNMDFNKFLSTFTTGSAGPGAGMIGAGSAMPVSNSNQNMAAGGYY
mmetsp:Transcript_10174/g.10150  ORF Transcript_10174/g.10150 Transcript_10174/m.10150 type:complete len:199 (-) Transcript_10174:21-617(-)